jgi:hypothetical protein
MKFTIIRLAMLQLEIRPNLNLFIYLLALSLIYIYYAYKDYFLYGVLTTACTILNEPGTENFLR